MLLDKKDINKEKQWLINNKNEIDERSNIGYILSDPTRIKIILLLKKRKELCVTDLANVIGVSVSAVSHQLSLLEKYKLTTSIKMGKTVCYFPNLKNIRNLEIIK